ncbi:MAG TPA: ATP-binding protein [Pyrinomonadaceae bacterium]
MSLFLKIFLWFWLAMALVTVALVASVVTTQERSVLARWHQAVGAAHLLHAQTAVELYESKGREALAGYLERAGRASQVRAHVFEAGGSEVLGRDVRAEVKALAAEAAGRGVGESSWSFSRAGVMGAHVVQSAGGRRYVVVGEMSRAHFGLFAADLRAQVLRLLAVVLTAGLVCYALARYLAAPVARLRAATRRVAGGDLTARVGEKKVRRRDELADLGRDFDVMAERIESLVSAQKRLLGDISHELRSPLARLSVALELAREKGGPAAELDRIGREAARLNDLISQLLALTRLEGGAETHADDQPLDLADILHETAADADFEARARGRAVRVVACESCRVRGSRLALRSALENVVRNAVRYTAEGSEVEITLRCERGGARDATPRAVIDVRDHGAGVPGDTLGELFHPFYRVDDARERRTGGVGLGLAIAERAVRLHGGDVRAFNAEGGGLCVEIRLPVDEKP